MVHAIQLCGATHIYPHYFQLKLVRPGICVRIQPRLLRPVPSPSKALSVSLTTLPSPFSPRPPSFCPPATLSHPVTSLPNLAQTHLVPVQVWLCAPPSFLPSSCKYPLQHTHSQYLGASTCAGLRWCCRNVLSVVLKHSTKSWFGIASKLG